MGRYVAGGRGKTRTCDLRCVRPMLYRLSYASAICKYTKFTITRKGQQADAPNKFGA